MAEFKEDAERTCAELEANANVKFAEHELKLLKAELAAKQAADTANEKVSELAEFKEGAELAFAGLEAKLKKTEAAVKKAAEATVEEGKQGQKQGATEEKAAKKPKVDKFDKVDLELEALAQRINSTSWEEESWRRSGWR